MTDSTRLAEALLPCPFCGSAPQTIDDNSYGDCWLGCMNEWNKRAAHDTLRDELAAVKAEVERRQSVLEIITGSVCAALSRAGFDDADDPGEAIDIITEERDALRIELAQARAAYEAGYSRGHNDTVESQYVEPAVAADEYLASLRISNAAREAHD